MLVFPSHFDRNGSYITHCWKKNSKKESEKLCKIVDTRNYPAFVLLIVAANGGTYDIPDDKNNNKTFNHTRGRINSQVSSQISVRNP